MINFQCMAGVNEEKFLRNKMAQIFSLVFVRDYPVRWRSFLMDLIQTLSLGPQAVENYLRVLLAIDTEVRMCPMSHQLLVFILCALFQLTDPDIHRTQQELQRNNLIKDTIRDFDISRLVTSWYQILV
jgi:exportin-T